MCGTLAAVRRNCRRAGIAGAQLAFASSLVPGAAEDRRCPLTQEPKLLAETLIAISSLLHRVRQGAARPVRGRLLE
jgi:hypothetical protein